MDETAFREVLSEMVERPCAFEKALQTRCVGCSLAERVQISEREAISCRTTASLLRCTALHEHLRHNFSFALKILPDATVLTHAQEMRVQCGGLRGLQKVLEGNCEVTDVDGLLTSVLLKWDTLEDISYMEVVHAAGECYKGRHEQP